VYNDRIMDSHQRAVQKAAKARMAEEVAETVLERIQASPNMAPEKDTPKGRFSPGHKLAIVMALIGIAMGVIPVLIDISPSIRIVLAALVALLLVNPIIHFIPRGNLRRLGFILLVILAVYLGWPKESALDKKLNRILALLERNAGNETQISLPGSSMQALISIHNPKTQARKYIWDVGTEKGARESVYVSADDLFTFAIVDNKGELYEVRSQLGSDGVPMDEVIYLACQVGITGTSTILSVVVNGKTRATTEFPVRLELDLRGAPGGRIGGAITDSNFGTFKLYWLAFYNRTLLVKEMQQDAAAARSYHPGIDYSVRKFSPETGAVPVESVVR
jgi:hypothetical protein